MSVWQSRESNPVELDRSRVDIILYLNNIECQPILTTVSFSHLRLEMAPSDSEGSRVPDTDQDTENSA
jgi:hypothetical protein